MIIQLIYLNYKKPGVCFCHLTKQFLSLLLPFFQPAYKGDNIKTKKEKQRRPVDPYNTT